MAQQHRAVGPDIWEAKSGNLQVQGLLGLWSEFKANLGYIQSESKAIPGYKMSSRIAWVTE